MNIPGVIAELGLLGGRPGLNFSNTGTCRLVFDFEALADGFTIHMRSAGA